MRVDRLHSIVDGPDGPEDCVLKLQLLGYILTSIFFCLLYTLIEC